MGYPNAKGLSQDMLNPQIEERNPIQSNAAVFS